MNIFYENKLEVKINPIAGYNMLKTFYGNNQYDLLFKAVVEFPVGYYKLLLFSEDLSQFCDRNEEMEKRLLDFLNEYIEPLSHFEKILYEEIAGNFGIKKSTDVVVDSDSISLINRGVDIKDAFCCFVKNIKSIDSSKFEKKYILGDCAIHNKLIVSYINSSISIDKAKEMFLFKVIGYKSILDINTDRPLLPLSFYKDKVRVIFLKNALNSEIVNKKFKELCLKEYPNLMNQNDNEMVNMHNIIKKLYGVEPQCISVEWLYAQLFRGISLIIFAKSKEEADEYVNTKLVNFYFFEEFLFADYFSFVEESKYKKYVEEIVLKKISDISELSRKKLIDRFGLCGSRRLSIDGISKNIVEKGYSNDLEDWLIKNYTNYFIIQNFDWVDESFDRNLDFFIESKNVEVLERCEKIFERKYINSEFKYRQEKEKFSNHKIKKRIVDVFENLSRENQILRELIVLNSRDEETLYRNCKMVVDFINENKQNKNTTIKNFMAIMEELKVDFLAEERFNKTKSQLDDFKSKIFNIKYKEQIEELTKNQEKAFSERLAEIKKSKEFNYDKYYAMFVEKLAKNSEDFALKVDKEKIVYWFENTLKYFKEKEEDTKISFVSNEFYYTPNIKSKGLDLSPYMHCAFKGYELFLCAFIKYGDKIRIFKNNIIINRKIQDTNFESLDMTALSDFVKKNFVNGSSKKLAITFDNESDLIYDINWIVDKRNDLAHKIIETKVKNVDSTIETIYSVMNRLLTMIAR